MFAYCPIVYKTLLTNQLLQSHSHSTLPGEVSCKRPKPIKPISGTPSPHVATGPGGKSSSPFQPTGKKKTAKFIVEWKIITLA